eukprot:TRINITY_DN2320_c0_g1_i2.p1 TRINITY_DN2320_c0_g1~~TRINITY_DN2320_c0_g1_i2.p1  ORF type:complete len:515 (+),score=134.14 TRINITY_DN2320_c0_g1_i2:172-1716(+)
MSQAEGEQDAELVEQVADRLEPSQRETEYWMGKLNRSFLQACEQGREEWVKVLISRGATLNPHKGKTPLQCAVLNGHVNVAKTLLVNGANPLHLVTHKHPAQGADSFVDTPLEHAIINGNFKMVELLVSHLPPTPSNDIASLIPNWKKHATTGTQRFSDVLRVLQLYGSQPDASPQNLPEKDTTPKDQHKEGHSSAVAEAHAVAQAAQAAAATATRNNEALQSQIDSLRSDLTDAKHENDTLKSALASLKQSSASMLALANSRADSVEAKLEDEATERQETQAVAMALKEEVVEKINQLAALQKELKEKDAEIDLLRSKRAKHKREKTRARVQNRRDEEPKRENKPRDPDSSKTTQVQTATNEPSTPTTTTTTTSATPATITTTNTPATPPSSESSVPIGRHGRSSSGSGSTLSAVSNPEKDAQIKERDTHAKTPTQAPSSSPAAEPARRPRPKSGPVQPVTKTDSDPSLPAVKDAAGPSVDRKPTTPAVDAASEAFNRVKRLVRRWEEIKTTE